MNRQDALAKCKAIRDYLTNGNPIWSKKEVTDAMTMAIEALSVDLVRCRECNYCYYADNRVSDERGYVCDYYHFETETNGYCHVGIRRKNDD